MRGKFLCFTFVQNQHKIPFSFFLLKLWLLEHQPHSSSIKLNKYNMWRGESRMSSINKVYDLWGDPISIRVVRAWIIVVGRIIVKRDRINVTWTVPQQNVCVCVYKQSRDFFPAVKEFKVKMPTENFSI